MIERIALAALLVALSALGVRVGRRWWAWRNERILVRLRNGLEDVSHAGDGSSAAHAPRIVYFTTTSCIVCRTQQEPAMEVLHRRVTDLVIEQHDAVADAELAQQYGVLSVPTTAVYDRLGRLVTINRGFTPAAVLHAQVEGREPDLAGGAEMASEEVIG